MAERVLVREKYEEAEQLFKGKLTLLIPEGKQFILRGRPKWNNEYLPVLATTVIVNGQVLSSCRAVIRQVYRTCHPELRHLCFETTQLVKLLPTPSSPTAALDRFSGFVLSVSCAHVCLPDRVPQADQVPQADRVHISGCNDNCAAI